MSDPHAPSDVAAADLALDQLDDYLRSDRSPPDCMTLSGLDGFLTGLAIGPSRIMPGEWLPVVWGGAEPGFANEAEKQRILAGILGRYEAIQHLVGKGAPAPVVWETADGDLFADEWADGFRAAMKLRWDEWAPLLNSKKHVMSVFPILALTSDADLDSLFEEDARAEGFVMEAPKLIPSAILEIAAFWRKRSAARAGGPRLDAAMAAGRLPPKVGRNEPCPCGSGRKFKKCCGP